MILIVDVSYSDDSALAAGIVIESWESNVVVERLTAKVDGLASYIPGKFYLRELPCIIELLKHVEHPLECIVVDGWNAKLQREFGDVPVPARVLCDEELGEVFVTIGYQGKRAGK